MVLERDGQDVGHSRNSTDLRLDGFWNRVIDREDHDRVAPRAVAPDLHAGDVDVPLAEQRSDRADDAGAIRMPTHQEGALRHEIDAEIVELHDMRLVEQHGAADPCGTMLTGGAQRDEVRELAGPCTALLDNGDAVGGGDSPGVDRVDALSAEPAEKRRE